jgi:hypothetical protein
MEDPIEYHTLLINDINNTIFNLLEQSDSERKKDISNIRKDIEYIRSMLRDNYPSEFPYNSIRIRFDGEYEIKLPKYGIETFDRKLKGEMYFSIIDGNDEYIDIKTTSFPKTFRIRLFYNTLDLFKTQKGKALLIYERGREKLKGDETTVFFKIVKLS